MNFTARAQGLFGGALRPGDAGPAVRKLQETLTSLGYEPGPADGVYGVLTEDAVRAFQKDYHLRVDGICGPETRRALFDESLLENRLILTVQAERSWDELADASGLPRSLVLRAARGRSQRMPEPGERLVVPRRWVTASGPVGKVPVFQVVRTEAAWRALLSARLVTTLAVRLATGEVDVYDGDWPGRGTWSGPLWGQIVPAGERWTSLLQRPRRCKGLFERIGEWVGGRGLATVVLQAGRVPSADQRRLVRFAQQLARALGPGRSGGPGRLLVAAPAGELARPSPVLFPSPWESLAARGIPLVVDATFDPGLPLPLLGRALRRAIRAGAPHRTWLALPLDALAVPASPEEAPERLSYAAALSRIYRFGGRLEWDPAGPITRGRLRAYGVEWDLLLESSRSLASKIALANTYQVYGVMLGPVGGEDPEVWRVVRSAFAILREKPDSSDGA